MQQCHFEPPLDEPWDVCQVWGAGVCHAVVWMAGWFIQASAGWGGAVGGLIWTRCRVGLACGVEHELSLGCGRDGDAVWTSMGWW